MSGTGFVEMVRRANAPVPPENSVTFRLATATAVVVGVMSCAAVSELSIQSALAACIGTVVGMVFSYMTRAKPWQWVKVLLAAAVLGIFASFVLQILGAARVGQLSSIEVPLAGLFTWVQLIHSFDVPGRRDLLFSLAAAGALLTLGAAQAVSVGFVVYVAIWLAACLVALGCSWRSMTGGTGPLALGSMVFASLVVILTGAVFLVFLPTPRAAQSITLPSSLISYLPLRDPGAVTGIGAQSTEPAKAGSATGRSGVGGYLGFASELDTGLRGGLGNEVVMRVRADRPGYFLGMTFDTWDGENWTRSPETSKLAELTGGSPFQVGSALSSFAAQQAPTGALPWGDTANGPENIQTFYVAEPIANLLFATPDPTEVYFPEHTLIVGADGSIRSTIAMNPGTVYTVISADTSLAPSTLAKLSSSESGQPQPVLTADLSLPKGRYTRVSALARRIVRSAHATTTYGEVMALEAWMARNVRYSTDIPGLLPGQDAVNQFLFTTKVGYCEQISTALAVMLRTLGVPTREAIGYVPGPFDPLSDLYEIQAKDAHAWVQVWFPGAGWQNFDPTAEVPLAPPDPGAILLADFGHSIARLPWAPLGGAAGAVAAVALGFFGLRRRQRRPHDWAERVAKDLERRGGAAGVKRRPAETLGEYALRLKADGRWRKGRDPTAALPGATALLERAAYGDQVPDAATRAFVEQVVHSLHPVRTGRPGSRGAGSRRAGSRRGPLTTA